MKFSSRNESDHQGAADLDSTPWPPWCDAFSELQLGEMSLASTEESYVRKKALSDSLLCYFKAISEDDVNYILLFPLNVASRNNFLCGLSTRKSCAFSSN